MNLRDTNTRNAKKVKAGKGFRQVTVLLPGSLFAAIEKAAIAENRFRTQQIITMLQEAMKARVV